MTDGNSGRTPFYRILWQVSHVFIQAPDVPALLDGVCQTLLQWKPVDRVRITQKNGRTLSLAAEGGQGEPPPLFWEERVVVAGKMLVQNHLLRPEGEEESWASVALFPLRVGGELWGTLSLYSRTPGAFHSHEIGPLLELARDLETHLGSRIHDQGRQDSDQFLSDMAQLVPGVFYKIRWESAKGPHFHYISPGIDLLLPFSPDQIQLNPRLVFDSLHPLDRAAFYRAANRSRKFLTVFNLEFRFTRPNGSLIWVLATAFPQVLDGTVVWTGLAIDVTPQNKLQEALQREQELLSVVLNNIGDGVVAIDEVGRLALVNRAASRLLDQPDGVQYLGFWDALEPDLPWDALEPFRSWYRTRSDGTVLHLEAHASDLADPGAPSRGKVLLLRDMTERDRMEARLRQSEKLESVGLLAGGIAHEFNNLLTGVFGFIQLAKMNADQPDKVEAYLDHAQVPFQRARTLTQQLLTFARGGEIVLVPLRLPEVLPAILKFTLSDSPLTWDWSAPEVPWTVLANEAQIHQVFENLFLNAKQALESGGHVHVELRNVPSPGPEDRGLPARDYLMVEVEDDGPGIPAEHLAKVFDPFFTTKAGGMGMGLSICFSVVKKHGGLIEGENRASGGARFRLFFPAQKPTAPGASG